MTKKENKNTDNNLSNLLSSPSLSSSLPSLHYLPKIFLKIPFSEIQGTNRDKKNYCQIHATNDYEALQCWLNEYAHKNTTYRTYKKETERFLLWCLYQQKKPLSSIDRDDLAAYIQFLEDPQPCSLWCAPPGGRHCQRGSPRWRPFTGPLSHSAKATALSAIDSLFNYLVAARYLIFNPLTIIKKYKSRKIHLSSEALSLHERILEVEEWHAILDTLENLPEALPEEKKEKERCRFLVHILYFLGLRIEELTTHTWNAFRKIENQWWFFVRGKGDKKAKIPVNDQLLRSLIQYRVFLCKPPLPPIEDTTPLIHSFRTEKAITSRQINKILKKLALATAKQFMDHPDKAKKIKKFSAHWLRHLSASMQDRSGIAFKHIRHNLRHENDETTRRYVHAFDQERYQDMQKLTLRGDALSLKQRGT